VAKNQNRVLFSLKRAALLTNMQFITRHHIINYKLSSSI